MRDQRIVKTYCLFCISGQENKIVEKLRSYGYVPLAPQVVRWKPAGGGLKKAVRRLLPGYVFFDTADQPDWQGIRANESVLRILQYDDGARALRDSDAEFVAWLKRYDGMIDVSHVITEGTKLKFIDGPLKEFEGKITKVNRNRKLVQVTLSGEESMMRVIWCSVEFIEENTEEDKPGQERR